jgi:hypothetical protein
MISLITMDLDIILIKKFGMSATAVVLNFWMLNIYT